MVDVDVVIAAYNCHLDRPEGGRCARCPWGYGVGVDYAFFMKWVCDKEDILDDAVEILKHKQGENKKFGIDLDGDTVVW